MKKSIDIFIECLSVQEARSNEYKTKDNQEEKSFNSTATAFNAITGKDITPAEVCLMLQVLKDVRQWSQNRLHKDSVLDGVSYASLKAVELHKQFEEK